MVDLDLMKQSLNVYGDHDDALIQHHIDAAVGFVEKHINRDILSAAPVDPMEPNQVVIDATLKQSIMQIAGYFYLNRENPTFGGYGPQATSVVDRLLIGYKRF